RSHCDKPTEESYKNGYDPERAAPPRQFLPEVFCPSSIGQKNEARGRNRFNNMQCLSKSVSISESHRNSHILFYFGFIGRRIRNVIQYPVHDEEIPIECRSWSAAPGATC